MSQNWIHSKEEWTGVLDTFTKGESSQFFCSEGDELGFVTTKLSSAYKPFKLLQESPGYVVIQSLN